MRVLSIGYQVSGDMESLMGVPAQPLMVMRQQWPQGDCLYVTVDHPDDLGDPAYQRIELGDAHLEDWETRVLCTHNVPSSSNARFWELQNNPRLDASCIAKHNVLRSAFSKVRAVDSGEPEDRRQVAASKWLVMDLLS